MRIPHTVIRVGNIGHSIDFYTRVLSMTLLRKNDYPDGQFTLAFVGYDSEANSTVIELIYNWGVDVYETGTGYGHIAVEVDGAYQACSNIRNSGGQATHEAGPMKHGIIAITFVTDSDDYKIKLIQRSP